MPESISGGAATNRSSGCHKETMSRPIRFPLSLDFVQLLQRLRPSWPALRLMIAIFAFIDEFASWPTAENPQIRTLSADVALLKRTAGLASSGNNRTFRRAIDEILSLGIFDLLEIEGSTLVWRPSRLSTDLMLGRHGRYCRINALAALALGSSLEFFVHALVEGCHKARLPQLHMLFQIDGRIWERDRPKLHQALVKEAARVKATEVVLLENPIVVDAVRWMELVVRLRLPASKWFDGALVNRSHTSPLTRQTRFVKACRLDPLSGKLVKISHALFDPSIPARRRTAAAAKVAAPLLPAAAPAPPPREATSPIASRQDQFHAGSPRPIDEPRSRSMPPPPAPPEEDEIPF